MNSEPIASVINSVMREARRTGSSGTGVATPAPLLPPPPHHHRRRIGVKLQDRTNSASTAANPRTLPEQLFTSSQQQ